MKKLRLSQRDRLDIMGLERLLVEMMVTISGEELERRLRRVSQLRQTILKLRKGALDAWIRGTNPIRPRIDVRSDPGYWAGLISDDEKRVGYRDGVNS